MPFKILSQLKQAIKLPQARLS